MAKKEINVFGASFLDLLSGALGAVIILYIIVPKLTITVEEFEEQMQLAEEVRNLGLSIDELSGMIPEEVLDDLRAQMEQILASERELQRKLASVTAALEECLRESRECTDRVATLERQLAETQNELTAAQQQLAQVRNELETTRAELQQCEADLSGCPDTVEEIEGDQRFIIVTLEWATRYHDVDLHVIDPSGNEFMYSQKTFPGVPGELTVDNRCGPGFEVWQIIAPRKGRYQVYANLWSREGQIDGCEGSTPGDSPTSVNIFHRNGVRSFPRVVLRNEKTKVLVATITVEEDGTLTIL